MSASDVDIADIYRPRPTAPFTSLADRMGLPRHSGPFAAFTKLLRVLTSKYLDEQQLLKHQDHRRWSELVREAHEMCNLVDKYEDAWPIESYVRIYLERTKYEHNKRDKENEAAVEHPVRRSCRIDASSKIHKRSPRELSSRSRSFISQSTPGFHGISTSETSAPDLSDTPASSGSPQQLEATCPTRLEALHSPKPRVGGIVSVENFLRALEPSMEDLAVRFTAVGIVDAGCLRGLARLNEMERYMLLKEDLRLDPFQLRVIRAALGRLI